MKRAIALILSIALLCCGLPAFAHGDQKEHDEDLKLVFFGKADYFLQGEEAKAFKAIADAAALCIDQFTTNVSAPSKKEKFNDLSRREKLSMRFEEIDLRKDKFGNGISASTHRRYTHLGWSDSSNLDPKFWQKRKKILLKTVQWELFSGSNPVSKWIARQVNNLVAPSKQCEAFCKMVYYVHILGDYPEEEQAGNQPDLVPLVQPANSQNPGLFSELKDCFQILFVDQMNDGAYINLMQELDFWRTKAEVNPAFSECDFKKLGELVSALLKNEDFFTQVFSVS